MISFLSILTSKFNFLLIIKLSFKYIGFLKYTAGFALPLISYLFCCAQVVLLFILFLISHKRSLSNIFLSVELSKLIFLLSGFTSISLYFPQFIMGLKDAIIYSLKTILGFSFIFFNSCTMA